MTNHLCAVSVLHSGMHRDIRFRSMNRWAGGINRWVSEQPVKLMRRALRCRLALGMWLAYPCAKGGSHENQDECEGWHVHLLTKDRAEKCELQTRQESRLRRRLLFPELSNTPLRVGCDSLQTEIPY